QLRSDHPARRAADPAKVGLLVLPVPQPPGVAGDAAQAAGPLPAGRRVGGRDQREAPHTEPAQGPRLLHAPPEAAVARCGRRRAGASLRRLRVGVLLDVRADMQTADQRTAPTLTPAALGIDGFDAFRPAQIEALERIRESEARVIFLQAPTGSG